MVPYNELVEQHKRLLEIVKDAVVFGYHSNECASMQPDASLDVPDAWGKCDCWLQQATQIVYHAPVAQEQEQTRTSFVASGWPRNDVDECMRCKHPVKFHENPSGICTKVDCPCNVLVTEEERLDVKNDQCR